MTPARKPLTLKHLADLHDSGLSPETITAAGFYSESNAAVVTRILNWPNSAACLNGGMVIPFLDLHGNPTGFARLKPNEARVDVGADKKPKLDEDGQPKRIKYEQPLGQSPRLYLPPLPSLRVAVESGSPLFITEGEKKSVSATQHGFPTLGLCGVWAWQAKGEREAEMHVGDREMIADMLAIPWNGREVWLCFDRDRRRKATVNMALAELAYSLDRHGATVRTMELPPGRLLDDGRRDKMGLDDFLVAWGADGLRKLIDQLMPVETRDLADYRESLAANRRRSVGRPGLYFDGSPAGSGKSFAEVAAVAAAGSSLTIVPTHKNCRRVERLYNAAGIPAAKYPKLSGGEHADEPATCLNWGEASEALACGLSVSGGVCPSCRFKSECDYWQQHKEAKESSHGIATHQRAAYSFSEVAKGRRYIAIHEDAAAVLRPMAEVRGGLDAVRAVADDAADEVGAIVTVEGYDLGSRAMAEYEYFRKVAGAAAFLQERLTSAEATESLTLPSAAPGRPVNGDATLLASVRRLRARPDAEAMRVCKAIAAGDLKEATVCVGTVLKAGGKPERVASICGVWRTPLPDNATVWVSDATATAEQVGWLAGRDVDNQTPAGRLARKWDVIQIPTDIKKSTAAGEFVKILRGALAMFPQYNRIGIICDRVHVPSVKGTARKKPNLDEANRRRIAAVEHFRSGEGRGSNDWIASCDALFVAGTPRVNVQAVRSRLLLWGNAAAVTRDGKWLSPDYWSGVTTSGRRRTVRSAGYSDHDWHAAHRAVVVAELDQCIGRGRAVLDEGIPVVVLSNENLGELLIDHALQPLSDAALEVLGALRRLSGAAAAAAAAARPMGNDGASALGDMIPKGAAALANGGVSDVIPKNNLLGIMSLSRAGKAVAAEAISAAVGKSKRQVVRILNDLQRAGMVRHVGQRGGWAPMFPSAVPEPNRKPPAPPQTDTTFHFRAAAGPPVATN